MSALQQDDLTRRGNLAESRAKFPGAEFSALPILDRPHNDFQTQARDPLVAHTVALLIARLTPFACDLIPQLVHDSNGYKLHQFFQEQDQDFAAGNITKPVFLSAQYRALVISVPDVDMVLKYLRENKLLNNGQEVLSNFAFNRLEFGIHEYGHLASVNKCIRPLPAETEKIERTRTQFIERIEQTGDPRAVEQCKEILADLRAEVFRREIDNGSIIRKPATFAEIGVMERVFPGGELYPVNINASMLLRMVAWYPLCRAMGPEPLAAKVIGAVQNAADSELPRQRWIPQAAAEFFEQYYQAHYFDREKFISIAERN